MHDPADDPAIVYPLDAAHIPRQIRPNSSPLLVAQPKQILAHDPDPLPKTNQDRILRAQMLMSFDPSSVESVTKQPNQKLQQTKSLALAHLVIDGSAG